MSELGEGMEDGMTDERKKFIGMVVVVSGGFGCVLVAFFGLGMIFYWHHVTGSWLDGHILFWQPIGIGCIAGAFFFTRVIAPLFGV